MNRAGNVTAVPARAIVMRAFLERLPQHFEHVSRELRQLVEKQHAVMRQADLAGTRYATAADERDVGDGVMRRAERTA